MIDREYKINMMIDNLPAVLNKTDINNNYTYEVGFPIGYVLNGNYYINNHLKFEIHYH